MDFKDWLKDQIEKQDFTFDELSDKSGLSKSSISFVLSGKRNVTRNFCVKIANGLGFDPVYVLFKAGLIDAPNLNEKTRELIEAVKILPDDKIKTVLRFAKFLKEEKEEPD